MVYLVSRTEILLLLRQILRSVIVFITIGYTLSGSVLAGGGGDDSKRWLLESDSSDSEGEPPPSYSSVVQAEGEYITVGTEKYRVICHGEVPVTMEGSQAGNRFSEVAYDGLVARDFPPGSYLKTQFHFRATDYQHRDSQYTTELWLFPNGVGSGEKRGRVLALVRNTRLVGAKKTARFRDSMIMASEVKQSQFLTLLTHRHPKAEKSVPLIVLLERCRQGFHDFGSSRDWESYTDEFGHNTFRFTVTPAEVTQRVATEAELGCRFKVQIPNGILSIMREGDGKVTPEGKVLGGGIASLWLDVDGQLVRVWIKTSGKYLETRIAALGGGTLSWALQKYYETHTPQASPGQQSLVLTKFAQEESKRFREFLSQRSVEILWNDPSDQQHLLGRFSKEDVRAIPEPRTFSPSVKSKVKYSAFIKALEGQTAVFTINISPPFSPPSEAEKLGRYRKINQGPAEGTVQNNVPALMREFHRLDLSLGALSGSRSQKVRSAL